jgi:predicted permease
MNPIAKWLTGYIVTLVLPYFFVMGSYAAISYWAPGEVRRESWAGVSELILYIAVPVLLFVAYASKISRWIRWPLATFGVLVFLGGIWYFQFTPLCGPYVGEKPIGSKPPPVRLASC